MGIWSCSRKTRVYELLATPGPDLLLPLAQTYLLTESRSDHGAWLPTELLAYRLCTPQVRSSVLKVLLSNKTFILSHL